MIPWTDALWATAKELHTCLCNINCMRGQKAVHLDMQISTATRLLRTLVLMTLVAIEQLAARVARQLRAVAETPWGMLSWLHSCASAVSCLTFFALALYCQDELHNIVLGFAHPTLAPVVILHTVASVHFSPCVLGAAGHVRAQYLDACP